MINTFCSTPQECMSAFMHNIRLAQKDSFSADLAFRDALICLLGLYGFAAEEDLNLKLASQLKKFRIDSCAELVKFEKKLRAYSDITLYMAEGANENIWPELCTRRSVIQIFLDHYKNTEVSEFINMNDVADLDQELRRVGLEQGPLSEEFIFPGLPESHWWWLYPKNLSNTIA